MIISSRPSRVKSVVTIPKADAAKFKMRQTGKISVGKFRPEFDFSIWSRQINTTFPNVPKSISFFPSRSTSAIALHVKQSWESVPDKTTGSFSEFVKIFLQKTKTKRSFEVKKQTFLPINNGRFQRTGDEKIRFFVDRRSTVEKEFCWTDKTVEFQSFRRRFYRTIDKKFTRMIF